MSGTYEDVGVEERWNVFRGQPVKNPKIDAFLRDVIEVCRRHGLSISHEDGAFMVESFSEDNAKWLMGAHDKRASLEEEVKRCLRQIEASR
jgi:hypothetical protein